MQSNITDSRHHYVSSASSRDGTGPGRICPVSFSESLLPSPHFLDRVASAPLARTTPSFPGDAGTAMGRPSARSVSAMYSLWKRSRVVRVSSSTSSGFRPAVGMGSRTGSRRLAPHLTQSEFLYSSAKGGEGGGIITYPLSGLCRTGTSVF